MKTLMIGQKGYPAKSGGIENHVEKVASRLAQKGHCVVVYSRHGYDRPPKQLPKNIVIKSLPTYDSKHLATPFHVFLATLHALGQEADIIHYHGIGPAFFSFIPRILKPRSKIIVTVHCQDYYHQKWGPLARTFLKLGEAMGIISAHKVTAVSPFLKEYLEEKYHYPVAYIPNGAEITKKADPNILNQWDLKPKQYILTVNRLIPHKDIHILIKAFKKLKGINKKLVIVGGSSFTEKYQNYLKKLARNDKRIIFTGAQNKKNLAALYQNCWLFVQPSREEGLSTVLLEALGAGSLVLTSDITANKFIAQKVGFTFKKGDEEDLAHQIKKITLVSSKKTEELKNKGEKLIKESFHWDVITSETLKVYQEPITKSKEQHQLETTSTMS